MNIPFVADLRILKSGEKVYFQIMRMEMKVDDAGAITIVGEPDVEEVEIDLDDMLHDP